MATNHFDAAFSVVFQHEGGFVDNPVDRGGPTNFGLTLHDLQMAGLPVNMETIKGLTLDQARGIYRRDLWDQEGFGAIESEDVAIVLFDQYVVDGHAAIEGLQKVLNVKIDAILGPLTVAAANRAIGAKLAVSFLRNQAAFYVHLARRDPSQMTFLAGWIDRVFSLVDHIRTTP